MSVPRRSRRMRLAALAGALAAALWAGAAAAAEPPPVRVADAWVRATPPHAAAGAAYMTLTSTTDDRLLAVATPAARQAELHQTTEAGGMMQMRPVVGGLALPAGRPVALQPGGYHIMLMGLAQPLRPGQHVMFHLTFAHAAPEDVTATVRPLGADPGMKMN